MEAMTDEELQSLRDVLGVEMRRSGGAAGGAVGGPSDHTVNVYESVHPGRWIAHVTFPGGGFGQPGNSPADAARALVGYVMANETSAAARIATALGWPG